MLENKSILDAKDYPVLYSFRRCPYAMRARIGLYLAGQKVEIREIILRNKPRHMIKISPKSTVPVLQLPSGAVIDESFDIMIWALKENDPYNLLADDKTLAEMKALVFEFDQKFKPSLDRYKYPDRYESEGLFYRQKALDYLLGSEKRLTQQTYLFGNKALLADHALFPFVRQFAHVDKEWFFKQEMPLVIRWLKGLVGSDFFENIMPKKHPWQEGDAIRYFPYEKI